MFLVVWTDDGFDRMNEIIRNNPGRKRELAVALRQITHQLTTDPLGVGEVAYERDEGDVRRRVVGVLSR